MYPLHPNRPLYTIKHVCVLLIQTILFILLYVSSSSKPSTLYYYMFMYSQHTQLALNFILLPAIYFKLLRVLSTYPILTFNYPYNISTYPLHAIACFFIIPYYPV